MTEQPLFYSFFVSPIGPLLLAGDEAALVYLGFPNGSRAMRARAEWVVADHLFAEAKSQLAAYFDGTLRDFDLPLRPPGTDFQKSVWQALRQIPYGETRSYADIAKAIGRPKATRAVGTANNANPLPVIVPCHRVIGANGSLTGFGGGLETKRFLLDLEWRREPASIGGLWAQ